MQAVSGSRRVSALLGEAADGPAPLVHAGRDAVYLEISGRCLGVVGRRAVAVPCALRSQREDLGVTSAEVRDGRLHLDGEPVVVGRIVDVAVPRPAALRRTGTAPAPPPGDVGRMIGGGDGLTPFNDDVVCGWLALHRAAGVPTPEVDAAVRANSHRTTLLSATLLDCAMHGEVVPEFARWVSALGSARETERAEELAAIGHSSGRGLLHGARLALAGLRAGDDVRAERSTVGVG